MDIVNPAIEEYALAHSTAAPTDFDAVAAATRRESDLAAMMVGPIEGRLLATLVGLARPTLAVEVGAFTGYSALWIASALPPGSRLVSCEVDERHARLARQHLDASPWGDRVEVVLGPAAETLAGSDEPIGFGFVDADKAAYPTYVDLILPRLTADGLLVLDNVLWGGSVLDPPAGDDDAEALAGLNDRLAADDRLEVLMLPVRDGVSIVRRRR